MEENFSVWLKPKNSKNSNKSKKKSGIYGGLNKYQEKQLELIEKDNILKHKEEKINKDKIKLKVKLDDLEKQKKIIKNGRKIIKKKLLDLKPYL